MLLILEGVQDNVIKAVELTMLRKTGQKTCSKNIFKVVLKFFSTSTEAHSAVLPTTQQNDNVVYTLFGK